MLCILQCAARQCPCASGVFQECACCVQYAAAAVCAQDGNHIEGFQLKQQLQTLKAELSVAWDGTDPSRSMLSEEPFFGLLGTLTRLPVLLIDAAGSCGYAQDDAAGSVLVKAYIPQCMQLTKGQLVSQINVFDASKVLCALYNICMGHFEFVVLQQGLTIAADAGSIVHYQDTESISYFDGCVCTQQFGAQLVAGAGEGPSRHGCLQLHVRLRAWTATAEQQPLARCVVSVACNCNSWRH